MEKRDKSLDCIKGIGIFLMVAGHASLPDIARQWIYGFHMPLFFILAGFMFNTEKWFKRGLGLLMKNRAKSYLIPYVVLFTINLIIYTTLETIQTIGTSINRGGYPAIPRYILAGLYSHDTSMPNCAPLWFLTCLFISYFYFWFLIKQKDEIKRILIAVVYLVILFCVNKMEDVWGIEQLPWHIEVALIASVFMLIGCELKKFERVFLKSKYRKLISIVCFIIGTVISFLNKRIIMVTNQYGNMILFLIGATAMSIVIFDISMRICSTHNKLYKIFVKLFSFWGRNTLIFIGFNYIINLVVRQFMKIFNLEATYIYSFVDIICVMIGCSIIALLWRWFHGKTDSLRIQ